MQKRISLCLLAGMLALLAGQAKAVSGSVSFHGVIEGYLTCTLSLTNSHFPFGSLNDTNFDKEGFSQSQTFSLNISKCGEKSHNVSVQFIDTGNATNPSECLPPHGTKGKCFPLTSSLGNNVHQLDLYVVNEDNHVTINPSEKYQYALRQTPGELTKISYKLGIHKVPGAAYQAQHFQTLVTILVTPLE